MAFVPAWAESRAGGRAGVGEQEGGRAGGRVVKRTELGRPRSAPPKGQPGMGSSSVTYWLRAWYRGTGVVDADGGAHGGVSLASRWRHRGGVLVAGGTATGLAAGGMPGCHFRHGPTTKGTPGRPRGGWRRAHLLGPAHICSAPLGWVICADRCV